MKRVSGLLMLVMGLWMLAGACVRNEESGRAMGQSAANTGGSASAASSAATRPAYTAYNLWYEKADNLYSTGYHVGAMIPAGTRVGDIRIDEKHITFTRQPDGARFRIEFVARHHPGLSIGQFCARLFVPKSFGELTEGFSADELEAVKTGNLRVGMSKASVSVAYGYPPEILTPSLESNTWTYQRNRFTKKVINFDANGRTMQGTVGDPNAL